MSNKLYILKSHYVGLEGNRSEPDKVSVSMKPRPSPIETENTRTDGRRAVSLDLDLLLS